MKLALVSVLVLGIASASSREGDALAPLVSPSDSGRIINDNYIVVIKSPSPNRLLPVIQPN